MFFCFSVTLLKSERKNPCDGWSLRVYQPFFPTNHCPFGSIYKNMKSTKPNWNSKLNLDYRRTVTGILHCMASLVFHSHGVYPGIQGYAREFTIYLSDPRKSQLPSTSSRCCRVSCLHFKNILTSIQIFIQSFTSSFLN